MYMTDEDMRRFKSCMVGAGYNITSLAKAIGMPRESLSARINGKVDFSRSDMNVISDKLMVSPVYLFFGKKVS